MSADGYFDERATFERVRAACCSSSPIDLDAHARGVVRRVLHKREQAAREQLDARLRRAERMPAPTHAERFRVTEIVRR